MKKFTLYAFLAFFLFMAFVVGKEALRTHSIVKVASTQLCIPKSYELSVNLPFLWFVDGLDEDAAGGLYLIPAEEIKSKVPGYTLSHINQHKVDLRHDITGIIWGDYQVGTPDGLATRAWSLPNETKDAVSVLNESLNMYEIGDSRFMDMHWHLAMTPPSPSGARPNEWYFGYCHGDKPNNYRCKRDFKYKNLYFDYSVLADDIGVAEEIEGFLDAKFKEWEQECKS